MGLLSRLTKARSFSYGTTSIGDSLDETALKANQLVLINAEEERRLPTKVKLELFKAMDTVADQQTKSLMSNNLMRLQATTRLVAMHSLLEQRAMGIDRFESHTRKDMKIFQQIFLEGLKRVLRRIIQEIMLGADETDERNELYEALTSDQLKTDAKNGFSHLTFRMVINDVLYKQILQLRMSQLFHRLEVYRSDTSSLDAQTPETSPYRDGLLEEDSSFVLTSSSSPLHYSEKKPWSTPATEPEDVTDDVGSLTHRGKTMSAKMTETVATIDQMTKLSIKKMVEMADLVTVSPPPPSPVLRRRRSEHDAMVGEKTIYNPHLLIELERNAAKEKAKVQQANDLELPCSHCASGEDWGGGGRTGRLRSGESVASGKVTQFLLDEVDSLIRVSGAIMDSGGAGAGAMVDSGGGASLTAKEEMSDDACRISTESETVNYKQQQVEEEQQEEIEEGKEREDGGEEEEGRKGVPTPLTEQGPGSKLRQEEGVGVDEGDREGDVSDNADTGSNGDDSVIVVVSDDDDDDDDDDDGHEEGKHRQDKAEEIEEEEVESEELDLTDLTHQ